jgi:hypothetical protein
MTETEYWILRDAVSLAKMYNVQSVKRLKILLKEKGHADADIDIAIQEWARYEKRKGA